MEKQKHAAMINDVTGYSRCSVAAALPILSVMKIQCSFIPTAILSANTNIKGFVMTDFTDQMPLFINHWQSLGLTFNAITSGYLGSPTQANIVIDFIKYFKQADTKVFIDPVMGDDGHLYPAINKEMIEAMKKLICFADVLMPNLTEACALLDLDYASLTIQEDTLLYICQQLALFGPKQIVITGIPLGNEILNYIYDNGNISKITVEKIGINRTGCGDVFSAILIGAMTNHLSFYDSVNKAVKFIEKSIAFTCRQGLEFNRGLCFEEYLNEL